MIDRSWIGKTLKPSVLDIERGRLRAFAQAIGETDPVYSDVEAAQAAGHADLPVPPTFLFAAEMDSGRMFELLTDMKVPLARLLHGEQGYTYHQPIHAGDVVTVTSRIADIYDKKGGALEFVEKTSDVRNQNDELVAELRTVFVVRN